MRTIVPAALLLAACSSTHVTFDRDASQEAALWSLELGETRVEVRTQGRDTLVSWRNRTLVFARDLWRPDGVIAVRREQVLGGIEQRLVAAAPALLPELGPFRFAKQHVR